MLRTLYLSLLATILSLQSLSGDCGNCCEPCPPSSCIDLCEEISVTIDPCYSVAMLSRLHDRSIKHLLLMDRWNDDSCCRRVLLSAQLRASAFYARASEPNRFGYLGRFPGDFRGQDASVADINDFTFAITYSPLSWVHGYWEFLHSDQITFSTDARQGTNHTQKVYAVIGNTDCFPLYMTIGKRDVGFGAMHTVNPFSPSITWHYFGTLHDGISLGYRAHGLHAEITALNGGRGIRVADTNEKGMLDNWAINGSYDFCLYGVDLSVGGGYLYSTIYDGNPPEHTGPVSIGPRNGAWNLNGSFCYGWLEGYGEITSTEISWLSTGHLVQTYSAGLAAHLCDPCYGRPLTLSLEHGIGLQGASNRSFRKNIQTVAAIDYGLCTNAKISFEYVQTNGFAPLVNIAGAGVSSHTAKSDVVQLGITLNI